jgi:glycosyltransferase involved in cell wall biosynthesis
MADKPLSVVHVVIALRTGGLEMLVLEMCVRMLQLQGVSVHVCALEAGDELQERARYARVPRTIIASSGPLGRWKSIAELALLFRRERPDVVHLHNYLPHVRGGLAAKLAGVPVVITTKHGASKPRLMRSTRLAGSSWRLADMVVPVSADSRDVFLNTYGFPAARARVILNGIDTDRFRPAEGDRESERQRVLGLTGTPLLGTVCRIVSEKGIPTLLAAFAIVVAKAPQARLVIVGEGPDRASCEQQAVRMGLAGQVTFLGVRGDVDAIYPLLDAYVQPSYTEGISLTMLEGCSCALPVVATAVGGNPEIVLAGQTGSLVPPRDAEALASAILRQWEAPETARTMGQAARRRVVECFSLDRMVADYIDLYRELLDARRAGIEG